MATITLKYNPRSKFAIALISLIKASSDKVEIIDSPYDKKYVSEVTAMDKTRFKSVKRCDLWK
ncbi:MAG: hypothetical protein IK017_05310 [Paludibacteraceae bacterium]|nr:hypothetical protein [Paludibacteraceae bacterium]